MSYSDELRRAMKMVADHPYSVFMGQGVLCDSTSMSPTFADVPAGKRLELPVMEDCQMGMAIGMALEGLLPVCVFPRWNFLLCAANQLVNHLDKLPLYSRLGYRPKVIIRTAIPSVHPFNPQAQHDADFTAAFRQMMTMVTIETLPDAADVVPAYEDALEREGSTLLVEYAALR